MNTEAAFMHPERCETLYAKGLQLKSFKAPFFRESFMTKFMTKNDINNANTAKILLIKTDDKTAAIP